MKAGEVTKDKDEDRPVYVPPALKVIGTASQLTLGPNSGTSSDGLFPHNVS